MPTLRSFIAHKTAHPTARYFKKSWTPTDMPTPQDRLDYLYDTLARALNIAQDIRQGSFLEGQPARVRRYVDEIIAHTTRATHASSMACCQYTKRAHVAIAK